nr:NHLP bacteriocin system secretion protein [Azospirillum thermophilum]
MERAVHRADQGRGSGPAPDAGGGGRHPGPGGRPRRRGSGPARQHRARRNRGGRAGSAGTGRPARRQAARAEKLVDQAARVRSFLDSEAKARQTLAEERRRRLEAQIAALRERERTLAQLHDSQRDLFAKGFTSREKVLAAATQLSDARLQRAEAENALVQLTTDEEAQRTRAAREVLENDMRLSAVEREIAAIESDIGRKTVVTAPRDGVVVEVSASRGDIVTLGAPVMRMLPQEVAGTGAAPLVARLYLPPGDGKKVKPGMAVQVIPSTVRVQRDGFIRGTVAEVSPIPATREGMMRVLKNSTLVEQWSRQGAPVEVTVRLEADPATPSGYRWSSGTGPDRRVEGGTIVEGRLVVDDIRLIALVVPQAETVLRLLGL